MINSPQEPGMGEVPMNIAPPPVSPVEAGMDMSAGQPMPGAGMTPEEMLQDIESRAADVESKNAALKSKEISNENTLNEMRSEVMQDLFATMKKYGVDPGDAESVRNFLEDLAEADPDLFEIFEMAFNNLTGFEEGAPEEGMMPPGMGAEGMAPPGMGAEGMAPPGMGAEGMAPPGMGMDPTLGGISPMTSPMAPPGGVMPPASAPTGAPGEGLMGKFNNLAGEVMR